MCVLTLQLRGHRFELRIVPHKAFLHLFGHNLQFDLDRFIVLFEARGNERELTEGALVDHGGQSAGVMHHGMLAG